MSGNIEDRLRDLGRQPALLPPAGLEAKVLAAMAAESRRRQGRLPLRAAAAFLLLGAGALLGLLAINGPQSEDPVDTAGTVAAADTAAAAAARDAAYRDLVSENARLERVLYQLPPPRRVMRVSTAGTIVGLENRIALIDTQLLRTADEAESPEYRTALMRDRVEVMNALVNVRYAQSRAFSF